MVSCIVVVKAGLVDEPARKEIRARQVDPKQ
jgi:hypothetical protein